MEFQCRVIVQRRCTSCCSSVENIPLQAERHSAGRQKLFAFPPESAFTFRPECCSESQRNRVRLQSGIAFTFDRIPQQSGARCAIWEGCGQQFWHLGWPCGPCAEPWGPAPKGKWSAGSLKGCIVWGFQKPKRKFRMRADL